MAQDSVPFKLPISVISLADLNELGRELEGVDDFFMKIKARPAGLPITLPKTSKDMEDIVSLNKLNLLQEADRDRLRLILQTLRTKSPVLHISFSSDPTRGFLEKIAHWFRENIDPLAILQIGLQPNIGAGFTLRTNNKFFDFSLRQYLTETNPLFVKELKRGLPHGDSVGQ